MSRINERGRYNPARLTRERLEIWKRPMGNRIIMVEALPDDICKCGHPARYHRGDPGPLGPCIVEKGFQDGVAGGRCDCKRFRAAPQTGQHEESDEVVEPGNENGLPAESEALEDNTMGESTQTVEEVETEQVEVGGRSWTDGLA